MSYISSHPFEKRLNETNKMKEKHPNCICGIVEKSAGSKLADLDKKKYLIPKDITVGQFIYVIRKRLKIDSSQAIFLMCNKVLPPSGVSMASIYETYKNEDGFLYMTYSGENAFG
jgi:GABA(A) receptor-associated protein